MFYPLQIVRSFKRHRTHFFEKYNVKYRLEIDTSIYVRFIFLIYHVLLPL